MSWIIWWIATYNSSICKVSLLLIIHLVLLLRWAMLKHGRPLCLVKRMMLSTSILCKHGALVTYLTSTKLLRATVSGQGSIVHFSFVGCGTRDSRWCTISHHGNLRGSDSCIKWLPLASRYKEFPLLLMTESTVEHLLFLILLPPLTTSDSQVIIDAGLPWIRGEPPVEASQLCTLHVIVSILVLFSKHHHDWRLFIYGLIDHVKFILFIVFLRDLRARFLVSAAVAY